MATWQDLVNSGGTAAQDIRSFYNKDPSLQSVGWDTLMGATVSPEYAKLQQYYSNPTDYTYSQVPYAMRNVVTAPKPAPAAAPPTSTPTPAPSLVATPVVTSPTATTTQAAPVQSDPYADIYATQQAFQGDRGTQWAQQQLTDPNAAWRTGTSSGTTAAAWQDPTASAWLDDAIGALYRAGGSDADVFKLAQYYGVDPSSLEATARSQFNADQSWAGMTGDQWVKNMIPSGDTAVDFSRQWLSDPYSATAGQGDLYAGMSARGYDDPFTRKIMTGTPVSLGQADLPSLTGSPFFNVAQGGMNVGYQNPDVASIYDSLRRELGTDDFGTLQTAAQYLYGADLGAYRPGSSSNFGQPTYPTNTVSGGSPSPIQSSPTYPQGGLGVSAFDNSALPMSGSNWRDTTMQTLLGLPGVGGVDDIYGAMYRDIMENGMSVSGAASQYGLNPGQITAVLDEINAYAQDQGKPLVHYSPGVGGIYDFNNYGFKPQKKLFTREVDGQSVVNPIAAYLAQINAQRNDAEQEIVGAASGGYLGGLNAVERDPAIKKYMVRGGAPKQERRGMGGQDDGIDAKLSADEYVFDADVVAALGDGSPREGARKLDKMRENIRHHKRSGSVKSIPPRAKSPEQYLKGKKHG